jgi:hypothetical protein
MYQKLQFQNAGITSSGGSSSPLVVGQSSAPARHPISSEADEICPRKAAKNIQQLDELFQLWNGIFSIALLHEFSSALFQSRSCSCGMKKSEKLSVSETT